MKKQFVLRPMLPPNLRGAIPSAKLGGRESRWGEAHGGDAHGEDAHGRVESGGWKSLSECSHVAQATPGIKKRCWSNMSPYKALRDIAKYSQTFGDGGSKLELLPSKLVLAARRQLFFLLFCAIPEWTACSPLNAFAKNFLLC